MPSSTIGAVSQCTRPITGFSMEGRKAVTAFSRSAADLAAVRAPNSVVISAPKSSGAWLRLSAPPARIRSDWPSRMYW